jgi:hypothetical protein
MIEVVLERTELTRKWRIPNKFLNRNFADFLNNTFPLEVGNREKNQIEITGDGSVAEYVFYFQLEEIHGITLDSVLKLLNDKGCIIKLNKKENIIQYHHQNIAYLQGEIQGRLR